MSNTPNEENPPKPLKEKLKNSVEILKKAGDKGKNILNGVIGDNPRIRESSLSVQMGFYKNRKRISLHSPEFVQYYPKVEGRIFILIHGLVSDETDWGFSEDKNLDYGKLLENSLPNTTAFYIRYNSGLHISENGKLLSELIQEFIDTYKKIKEINIIAHSMGGLVTRSANYYASENGGNWIQKVNKIFFLGSPHLGSPLEKFGNVVTNVLGVIPNPFTYLAKNIINQRSAGIKDLRFGYIKEEDWSGKNPDEFLKNHKTHTPLLDHIDYYVITGTMIENPDHILNLWFGDYMVRKKSALGKTKDSSQSLNILESHHKEFLGYNHMKLMHDQKVFETILDWCKS